MSGKAKAVTIPEPLVASLIGLLTEARLFTPLHHEAVAEELDRVPPSKIDHPHRDRLALLIVMAGERPVQVGDVLRVLWPDASIATANRSLLRLLATPGIPFFASIDGAKRLGTIRVVRLTPWPSAGEMFGDAAAGG